MKSIKNLNATAIDPKQMNAMKGGASTWGNVTIKGGGSRPSRPTHMVLYF